MSYLVIDHELRIHDVTNARNHLNMVRQNENIKQNSCLRVKSGFCYFFYVVSQK